VSRIPDGGIAIRGRHGMSSRLFKRIKHGLARSRLLTAEGMGPPDYFLIELFNPADVPVKLSFVARNLRGERRQFPYQRLLVLEPGFRRFKIPFDEIARQIDVQEEMHLIFNPNLRDVADEGRTLYFGLLGFVKDAKYRPPGAAAGKTVKVLVWDLDNTVWDGILVEDGPEKISLRPGVAEVIQELDRRGIMNSVASKNDPAFAMEQLERFGLAEYMVFPKIGWGPKSESIRQIVEDFDVGADTVAFIDDSPFERAEVMGSNPKVRVYRHDECGALLERSDFTTSKTAETGKRRQFYQNQALRRRARESFSGEYADFLRSCGIVLDITHARESNLDRVHELIQRTNQMNFSGSKYSRTEVERICGDADYETFCMTATDKFGDYGMIGACVVRKAGPRIVDLMFSCRIQAKRVEHAFLMLLLDYYRERGYERLEVVYRRTERNAQAGRVFED
ncbi:MAG: HAD-IIIC family phosphatase, partial [Pseudonocardiaceae bacterium]